MTLSRHGRVRPGHLRLTPLSIHQGVDARDKRGHDAPTRGLP